MRRRGVAGAGALGAVALLGALGVASLRPSGPGGAWRTLASGASGESELAEVAEAPVADAAMRRDTLRVRTLLREGADVNAAQGDGMTALHWAATHGDAAVVRMLTVAGARLDAATRNGNYTPLHLASRAGQAGAVAALLEAGADVNAATSSGGATPLHLAAATGDTAVVGTLVRHKATVDARESAFGQTPLMWAAAAGRLQAVRALLAAGADLSLTSTVTDMAAAERSARAANQVRQRRMAALKAAEQPARPPAAATPAGQPAARPVADSATGRRAATPATPAGARTSVDSGRAPGAPSAAGTPGAPATPRTAADSARAAETRSLSYGELVGKSGGLTPLLFAVRQGHAEVARALLDAGADVNQVSAGDHTSPLLMATINGQFDLAMQLLARGGNARLASDAGTTPLYATINVQWAPKSLYPQPTAQYQQQTTHLQLMEALLKAGADVNARLNKHLWFMSYNFDLLGVNTEGATPFWRAAYGLDIPAMKLLLANGADPRVATRKPAGRLRGDDAPAESDGAPAKDPSGLPPVPVGGPGVHPIHAASGVGYGEGYAANSHRHAPDAWIPAVKFLIEEVGANVNERDHNGFTPLHHAAARGDNALIEYLLSKGGDISAVARRGQTVADMANGPVQRIPPFVETVKLLEKLGSKNSNKCRSC